MKHLKKFNENIDIQSQIEDECSDILVGLKDDMFDVKITPFSFNENTKGNFIITIDKLTGFYYEDISDYIKRISKYLDTIDYRMFIYDKRVVELISLDDQLHYIRLKCRPS